MPQPVQLSGQAIQGFATAFGSAAANQTTTATTSGTSTVLMTAGPADFAGGIYDAILSCAAVTKGTTNVSLELWLDGVFNQSIVALSTNASAINPFYWQGRLTIVAGVHTVTVRGFVDAGTGTLVAGTGATGANPNAVFIVRPA